MCKEYDYIYKIEEAEKDIRLNVKAILNDCPKKILKKSKKMADKYYRLKRSDIDNYPYFLSNPKMFRKRGNKEVDRCKMCGLSVFEDLEDVRNVIKKFRSLPPIVYVMKAGCNKLERVGEVYYTPSQDFSSHRTFFPCVNYNPEEVWEFYEEIYTS